MMIRQKKHGKVQPLLNNSRFWVLSFGLIVSLIILGLVQQLVPAGNLQNIRLEQIYGFVSLFLLFLALLATPLTKAVSNLPLKDGFLHSRRAIGVLAFYYAFLHVLISFFKQLDGFRGLKYLDDKYLVSIVAGMTALLILMLMALTSMDWAVRALTFKNWKRLHRFVYAAGWLIILHVFLIGTHYIRHTIYFYITIAAIILLILLEIIRVSKRRHSGPDKEVS